MSNVDVSVAVSAASVPSTTRNAYGNGGESEVHPGPNRLLLFQSGHSHSHTRAVPPPHRHHCSDARRWYGRGRRLHCGAESGQAGGPFDGTTTGRTGTPLTLTASAAGPTSTPAPDFLQTRTSRPLPLPSPPPLVLSQPKQRCAVAAATGGAGGGDREATATPLLSLLPA